ncbi:MAG TPA: hypothetical protein VD837_13280 [Terriglobales bacterium]|nr:hypothetical protein [Terriglobales bacterium]
MQFAKDSFYMTLRERLAALNAERTVMLEGVPQPAIVVAENEISTGSADQADCFHVRFGAAKVMEGFARNATPLMALACTIGYRTRGTQEGAADRGRSLAALDGELMAICLPMNTDKLDYAQVPPQQLQTRIFWTTPELGDVTGDGNELSRTAALTIFFYPEEQRA